MNDLMSKAFSVIKSPNVLWNIIGISLNSFYSLILIIVITRINGLEVSGQFSFAYYMTSTFLQIGAYGGRIYQVSDISGKYNDSDYVSSRLLTGFIMTMVTMIFCLLNGYDFFKISLFIALILYRYIDAISEAYYAILQKNGKLSLVGKSMSVKALLGMTAFIIIDVLTKNIVFASLGFAFSYFLIFFLFDKINASMFANIAISMNKKILALLIDSYQVFLFSFLNIFMLNITRYFVDLNLSNASQGYYGILIMPASLIALFSQFLVQPMVKGLVNLFEAKKYEAFRKHCILLLTAIVAFGIFASVISYFVLGPILSLIYHIDFSSYNLELALIVLAGIFSGATTVISTLLVIMRRLNSQLYGFIISVVLCCLISFFMVHSSVNEAIFAYLLSMLIEFFIFLTFFVKIIYIELKLGDKEASM